jgi:hypothetical protein
LFKKTYIVIDALDEVPDDARLHLLDDILSLQASRANLLLTSRPLQLLEPLHQNAEYIQVDAENWKDIELFIHKQIENNRFISAVLKGNPADRDELCAKLKQKCQGMYVS